MANRHLRVLALFFLCMAFAGQVQAQNLVTNGDFEAGNTGWTVWSASSTFWNGAWSHSNDCDIWVPTNGCPLDGAVSHAQKKGNTANNNAHGGLYQVISVETGRTYQVDGSWSGGVTGNVDGNNGSWWEVAVYDGVVSDATIDAGLRPQDTLIAKREANNLASGEAFQFQWEGFAGTFTAQSNTVTLALKVGSYSTFEAAGYHDNIGLRGISTVSLPMHSATGLVGLALLLLLVAGLVLRNR